MINILIPLAGPNQFFPESEYPYPKSLIEISGKTMIEHVISNFSSISGKKQFIFIVNNEECKKYHLDDILNLLTDDRCKIIKIERPTKGAACSAMMAIEHINNSIPLIIANADQIFDDDLGVLMEDFKGADAGVLTFESIHPRWSYARVDTQNHITETAEKRPISKHAIAGLYYFSKGSDFIESTMRMIKKDANVNGVYFIAPVLNEMVLNNKLMKIKTIENSRYHTFYTPSKIHEYERNKQC
ncbi:MAG: glycosyltransferase family 2 protein [Sulfuricurvum sp.]|nr:glycosyltransferase family 2 protein [Sulfuricurvum sp.]